jgi:hypothetical protein
VTGTQISRDGVVRFQRAVPACHVTADFGIYPADYITPAVRPAASNSPGPRPGP